MLGREQQEFAPMDLRFVTTPEVVKRFGQVVVRVRVVAVVAEGA